MSICRIVRGRRIYEPGEFPADCLVSRSAKAAPIRPPVSLVISSGKIRLRSTATVKPRCEASAEAPQTRKAAFITFVFYRQFLKKDYVSEPKPLRADDGDAVALKPSKPGVIITIAREHGSSGKQIGKLAAQKLGILFSPKCVVHPIRWYHHDFAQPPRHQESTAVRVGKKASLSSDPSAHSRRDARSSADLSATGGSPTSVPPSEQKQRLTTMPSPIGTLHDKDEKYCVSISFYNLTY